MPNVLLDYVLGSQAKRPFVRKTWVDRNTTKRAYRIKALDSPGYYKSSSQAVLFGDSFQPFYGIHTGTQHITLRGSPINLSIATGYNVTANPLLGSTDGMVWSAKNLPGGQTYSAIGIFNSQLWVYSRSALYVSTDLNGTSWSTSVNSPTGSGNLRPIVFGTRIVTSPGAESTAIYSNTTASSFSTHTLPVSMMVTGMATDGTTLIIVGHGSSGAGYVYKTTDLTNFTLVSVKLSSTDAELSGVTTVNGVALSASTAIFTPLGVTYNGSTFVIIAIDTMLLGGAINDYTVSAYRVYTGSSAGPFLAKSEIRTDFNNAQYTTKNYFANMYKCQQKTGQFITSDSSGRVAVGLAVSALGYVDANAYWTTSPCIAYSDDNGETWTLSEISTRPTVNGFTGDLLYMCTHIYPSPNGFVVFYGNYGANSPDFCMITNANAREMAMPY